MPTAWPDRKSGLVWLLLGRARGWRSVPPPLCRRDADESLERAAERRFGLVTDVAGDRRDLGRAVGEHASGQLQPPLRQVLHGGLADEAGKGISEARARDADFTGKRFERPRGSG